MWSNFPTTRNFHCFMLKSYIWITIPPNPTRQIDPFFECNDRKGRCWWYHVAFLILMCSTIFNLVASRLFFWGGRFSNAVSVLKLASVSFSSTTIPSLATNTTFANFRCCLPSRSSAFSSLYDQVLTHGPLGKLKVWISMRGGYCSFMIECALSRFDAHCLSFRIEV